MKRIFIIASLLLITISSFAQSGKSIYEKYSDKETISAVYISPAMFKMIGKIPDFKVENDDINLAPIINSLSGMYILNFSATSANKQIRESFNDDMKRFISSNKYELLLEAKEDGEMVRMYTIGDAKVVNGFVILANQKEELSFICIEGKMSRADLEKVLEKQIKK
ncbi:MAG: DUF4252 domain-containing protein [Bacteroidales bacterium]|nr:DUF4252 domain-containing protein [Bacteroidales bacterium]